MCWVLLKNSRPERCYLSKQRAQADYELASGVLSESDYFELHECCIVGDEDYNSAAIREMNRVYAEKFEEWKVGMDNREKPIDVIDLLKRISWGYYTRECDKMPLHHSHEWIALKNEILARESKRDQS